MDSKQPAGRADASRVTHPVLTQCSRLIRKASKKPSQRECVRGALDRIFQTLWFSAERPSCASAAAQKRCRVHLQNSQTQPFTQAPDQISYTSEPRSQRISAFEACKPTSHLLQQEVRQTISICRTFLTFQHKQLPQ